MKKNIFIDWNKTLSHSLFWEQLQDKKHPHHKYLSIIEKWLFVDNRAIITPWMRGKISSGNVLKRMSQETGIDQNLIASELQKSCENMQFCIKNLPELIAKIQKRGVKVVIATDNMDVFFRYTVPAMQLDKIFDDILSSHKIGYLKDDELPENKILFFDKYLAENKLTYDAAVLLDDSLDKTGKYQRLGFERILINAPTTLKDVLEKLEYAD